MTDLQLIQMIRTIALPLIVFLTVAIAARQVDRVMRHRLFGDESPEILIRDVLFFWALVALVAFPALAGAMGVTLGEHLWWVIVRSIIGVGAFAVVAYYEVARIGRQPK